MTPDRSLRGCLIAMLLGAALLVLGQVGSWPPETGFERALSSTMMAGPGEEPDDEDAGEGAL